jgi:hypothetical protein
MKRMFKVLMVAVFLALILAASISPALARTGHFGKRLNTDRPCYVHSHIANAQHGRGAHIVDSPIEDPDIRHTGCWVVLPG